MMRSPVWHPFTQHAVVTDMPRIVSAEGAWLRKPDETALLDAISSWWVITHGHCNPRIVAAAQAQLARLDQVIFAGLTHDPAEDLARRLVELTGLDHVFFSDSGSTSVEVALKMALGYWFHTGQAQRARVLVLEHSYHGDTIGTMSVGARGVFNAPYEPLMFDVGRLPFPREGREQATLDALEAACRAGDVAALLVEPLVLGAGGMLMYAPSVLTEMHRICQAHDVLFIADEVMTGWGRTGTLFACEQAGLRPDIACYAKGLTGGSLPLAVTACTAPIFEAHYSTDRRKTFFHSSSYTANPVACAAAVANLDIWREEPVAARLATIAAHHSQRLEQLAGHPKVASVRQCGTIAALDLTVSDQGYLADVGPRLYRGFLDRGVLLRPLGNTVYVLPPYCVTNDDLDRVYDVIADTLAATAL